MTTINITVVGNATRDPELRFTPSGVPVASFGVAVNKRKKDGDQWVDAGVDFYNVTAWRDLGTNVAESIDKGQRIIVTGRLEQREYEAKDGTKRTSVDITADEIGPSLRWATAETQRNERSDSSSSAGYQPPTQDAYSPSEEPF
jgi:single-strand DNA-binding protein